MRANEYQTKAESKWVLHSFGCEVHLIYCVQAAKVIRTQGIKLLGAGCWVYICGELRAYFEFAVVGF